MALAEKISFPDLQGVLEASDDAWMMRGLTYVKLLRANPINLELPVC